MDMQFYYAHDQVEQKLFEVNWKPVHMNLGDYFTKNHHPHTIGTWDKRTWQMLSVQ